MKAWVVAWYSMRRRHVKWAFTHRQLTTILVDVPIDAEVYEYSY